MEPKNLADAADKFTYNELLTQLRGLSTDQLNQQVRCVNERGNGKATALWVLNETHIDPSGEGMEAVSAYPEMSAEEIAEEPSWPEGYVLIQTT